MDKRNSDFGLNKIGLFKVFSNLDTQSAVIAAIVISLLTVLATGFMDLCNYIYWNAYFTSFNIPLAYIDEAIIHENGGKYLVALCVPVLVFIWWLLTVIRRALAKLCSKLKGKSFIPSSPYIVIPLKLFFIIFIGFCMVCVFFMLLGEITLSGQYILFVLYTEFFAFVVWSISKATIGRKASFSKKFYYIVRVIGILITVYLVLANVYFSGSMQNYGNRSTQSLQIVYDSEINYIALEEEDEIDSQLILFETEDYYYVTDVTVRGGNVLRVKIWNNDSYRFISKIDCPVKTIYGNLFYVDEKPQNHIATNAYMGYVITSLAFGIAFILFLSIPKREEIKED